METFFVARQIVVGAILLGLVELGVLLMRALAR